MDEKPLRRLRLRAEVSRASGGDIDTQAADDIFVALAELTRLRAEVERLRAAWPGVIEISGGWFVVGCWGERFSTRDDAINAAAGLPPAQEAP